ncbi:hypothetical protein [Nocardia tengchongensis]
MAREVDQDELIDAWTIVGGEPNLIGGERGATRLGFAILLCFYIHTSPDASPASPTSTTPESSGRMLPDGDSQSRSRVQRSAELRVTRRVVSGERSW